MVDHLTELSNLSTQFAQIGLPKPDSEINDCILAQICLALMPTMDSMSVDPLKSLLLNQEAKRDYKKSKCPVAAPLSGLLEGPPGASPVINVAVADLAGRGRRG